MFLFLIILNIIIKQNGRKVNNQSVVFQVRRGLTTLSKIGIIKDS